VPPEYLMGLLLHIEVVVLDTCKENPSLIDKDIEFVYQKLERYFKTLASGKIVDEPSSTFKNKEILIDAILDALDERDEENMDDFIIQDVNYLYDNKTIPSIDYLNMLAFKRLAKSVKMWRKKDGRKGYQNYIADFLKKLDEDEDED